MRQDLIIKTNVPLGETISPTLRIPAGDIEVKVGFDVLAKDWDDPDLRITVVCERWNGTQWVLDKSSNFIGNTRGKGGGFPSLSIILSGGDIKDYRFKFITNKRVDLGLVAEVPDSVVL